MINLQYSVDDSHKRCKRAHSACFHLYNIQNQANLTSAVRNQDRDYAGLGTVPGKEQERSFWRLGIFCFSIWGPHVGVFTVHKVQPQAYDMHTFYINVNLEVYLDLNEWALGCLQTTPVGDILVYTPCAEMETFL